MKNNKPCSSLDIQNWSEIIKVDSIPCDIIGSRIILIFYLRFRICKVKYSQRGTKNGFAALMTAKCH